MARKKAAGGGGAPEWLVTFADLMSLLVCFFVLIISFSSQDEKKLSIVAGSMREAFGSQSEFARAGLIEVEGLPINEYFKQVSPTPERRETNFETEAERRFRKQGPEVNSHNTPTEGDVSQKFLMAAASLRQALQDMPDYTEVSNHVIIHEDEEGLHIELVDQDGRAMFPPSSRFPHPMARDVLVRIAPVLRKLSNPISVTGHTSASNRDSEETYSPWELSADRAEVTRQILTAEGILDSQFHMIAGKGESQPLFVNDMTLAANRRVTILLMDEKPPLPVGFTP